MFQWFEIDNNSLESGTQVPIFWSLGIHSRIHPSLIEFQKFGIWARLTYKGHAVLQVPIFWNLRCGVSSYLLESMTKVWNLARFQTFVIDSKTKRCDWSIAPGSNLSSLIPNYWNSIKETLKKLLDALVLASKWRKKLFREIPRFWKILYGISDFYYMKISKSLRNCHFLKTLRNC